MARPNEKLAASLAELRELQRDGRRVFQSKELPRTHRERLLRLGFLRPIMKGWLVSSSPTVDEGDSTPWFASFWEFCGRYCAVRFGHHWQLSAEQSLLLHAENSAVPTQVMVYSPQGSQNATRLPFETSLYDHKDNEVLPPTEVMVRDGLRLYVPAAALVRVPEAFFVRSPVEARTILVGIKDASDVLSRLLSGGHSFVAGRLAGAFRRVGRTDIADEIGAAMKAAGYNVRESDPFTPTRTFAVRSPTGAPIVERISALWESTRTIVAETLPKPPGPPRDRKSFLTFIDGIYQSDAYHSLSIEGYQVTPELIEHVRSGAWDPERRDSDRQSRDALAARGYWQAFQLVKQLVGKIIAGENPGTLTRSAHRDWYRELFQPCVAAGLIAPESLAGYRGHPVYLRASRHIPPRWEAVRDAMPALFDLLESEPHPGVRAVLGHWLFGYIHPYPDGNGRMARFLMNAMLASGGYPWTVIRVEDRGKYLDALESASVLADIRPFAAYLAERVRWSMRKAG
ncbi:MAG: Fic family protein [Alphaproteobacteria bacterium]|nr:Fic family protein [Alphaproteobacteria bacterium]